MKLRTNHRGMVEILLLLPLFLGLLCVIAWIGFLLISKSKMEKHAWLIQTKKTYEMEINPENLNEKYEIESNRSWIDTIQTLRRLTQQLPTSFKSFLAINTTDFKKLTLEGHAPSIINNFYLSAFKESEDVSEYLFSADMIIPGDPLNSDGIFNMANATKNAMWAEAMAKAGFRYPALKMLGIVELLDIAELPLGRLAEISGILNTAETIQPGAQP